MEMPFTVVCVTAPNVDWQQISSMCDEYYANPLTLIC